MGLTRIRADQVANSDFKQACRAIVTSNIANFSGGAPLVVDGVTLLNGNRVLVNGQTDGTENGLYKVNSAGIGSNGTWSRTSDANENGELESGMQVMVTEGTVHGDTEWTLTSDGTIDIGTTSLTFEQLAKVDSTAGHVIQNAGSNLAARTYLNFDGTYLVATDDSGNDQTDVTVSAGLQSWNSKTAPSGDVVGTSDTQTLTNKTLTSPNMTSPSISGVAITATATELNLLDGKSGTVWTSTNDGSGSGLDADTLDGVQGSGYAQLSGSPTFTGGALVVTNSSTGRVGIGNDAGGSFSLGLTNNTASSPYIDFNSGGTTVDYDVRIQTTGGTGTSGGGTIAFTAGKVVFNTNTVARSQLGIVSTPKTVSADVTLEDNTNSMVIDNLTIADGISVTIPDSSTLKVLIIS